MEAVCLGLQLLTSVQPPQMDVRHPNNADRIVGKMGAMMGGTVGSIIGFIFGKCSKRNRVIQRSDASIKGVTTSCALARDRTASYEL